MSFVIMKKQGAFGIKEQSGLAYRHLCGFMMRNHEEKAGWVAWIRGILFGSAA